MCLPVGESNEALGKKSQPFPVASGPFYYLPSLCDHPPKRPSWLFNFYEIEVLKRVGCTYLFAPICLS